MHASGTRAAFLEGLKARIDWLAFEREYSEHALVNATEWFAADEAFESFDPQGELTCCERSLPR